MRLDRDRHLFGPVMFWTILTTVFAWLPLVRIVGRPEGYHWGVLGLSGEGADGPFWIFILLTLYALALLFSAHRGPSALFHPLLVLWHAAVTGVVVAGTLIGGADAAWQGQGLHWSVPMWLMSLPCAAFLVLAVALVVVDRRRGLGPATVPWSRRNTARLAVSLLLLAVGLALFRAGTNYNWVTAAAIVATILHWVLLAESFQPRASEG